MKYLLITHDFFPNDIGGMTNYYTGLAQGFPQGTLYVVTATTDKSDADKNFSFNILRTSYIKRNKRKWYQNYLLYRQIKKIVKSEQIDIVLCGNFRPYADIGNSLHRKLGIPYYIFFHGNDVLRSLKSMKRNWFKRLAYTRVLNESSGFITNSNYVMGLIPDEFKPEKNLMIVNPGVENSFLDQEIYPPLAHGAEIRLLSVGRLSERKGVSKVMEAMVLLKSNGYDLRYDVVGRGNLEHYKTLATNHGLQDQVIFHGFMPENEVVELYKKCDILVMVSNESLTNSDVEGFGIVYLEANAFGKPVIGSCSGGIPDAVKDNVSGLLVKNPLDASEIAQKLKFLCDNPETARQLGEAGHKRVNQDFSYNLIVERMTRLIEKEIN